jgi:AGZA family xanthine/uracil permease-like MFS transporter
MGKFNTEIYIAMIAFITIGLALHYRVRGAFLIGMLVGTFVYWAAFGHEGRWPPTRIVLNIKDIQANKNAISFSSAKSSKVLRLVFDLYVIGVILLNGLAHGLAETAQLKREDNTLPRGKWLYASCGIGTLLSAFIGSGPIMISPESAPGIKAGARTGLSTAVCGCCFLVSLVFCPLFAAVPTSGTSPILLMIGMFMFEVRKYVSMSTFPCT